MEVLYGKTISIFLLILNIQIVFISGAVSPDWFAAIRQATLFSAFLFISS